MKPFNHWPLVALLVVFYMLAGVFSLLLPLDETPDEQAHFSLVRFIAENHRFPMTNQERDLLGDKGDASPIYHGVVAVLSQHVDISTLPERHSLSASKLFIPYDTIPTTRKLHTESEQLPFRGIVLAWHLARLVSVFLNTLTIIATYLTVLKMYPQQRYFALAAAGFVAFVPYFVINSVVVNDDNLVIPLTAFAIYYLVRIIHGDERWQAFTLLGVLIGLAVITKYHTLVLLLELTFVFLILALQNWPARKQWFRRWGLVMLSFFLTTGWWFFFLFVNFNRVDELGLIRGLLSPLGDPTTTESTTLLSNSPSISWGWIAPVFRSFWIVAGLLRRFAPDIIYQILLVVTIVALFGVVRAGYKHLAAHYPNLWRPDVVRPDIALLGLHALLYVGIIFGRYQVFVARGVEPPPYSTQGRHLYPALIAIAFFYVFGLREGFGAWFGRLKNLKFANRSDLILAGFVNFGLLGLSISLFFFFVLPIYPPYLPLVALDPDDVEISHRMDATFAEGVNFVGYNLSPPKTTNNVLPVELYWQASVEHDRDYLVQLCLRDEEGVIISCQWNHPADGLYPMRAWDAGYLIRDEHALPLPSSCLAAGAYELTLLVWPLRNDSASTVLGKTESVQEPLSLGSVTLVEPPPSSSQSDIYLCAASHCQSEGKIKLSQIRQALTVVSYQDSSVNSSDDKAVYLALNDATDASVKTWLPVASSRPYRCPNGQTVQTHSFIVDESVTPGLYSLAVNDQPKEAFSVRVRTRLRNFNGLPSSKIDAHSSFADQLVLLGYDVDLSPRMPDAPIEVTTSWQTKQRMSQNYNIALHLLDNTLTTQLAVDHPLGQLYPNVLWAPGEFTQDKHILQGDKTLPPGLYTLELRLYDHSQKRFQALPMVDIETNNLVERNPILGHIRIMDSAHGKSPTNSKSVYFGQTIQLLGYDLPDTQISPGETLSLALYWQAIDQPSTDYTVFTQLIGPDGLVWGQQDNRPQQGKYPTTAWTAGDRVVDRYEIIVREDAPVGAYILLAGMYDLTTGERLPAIDAKGYPLPNNAVVLDSIDIRVVTP